mmetsp:Transcript_997/g.2313  ORF Transcript_997/g.2313 Transcript_997/m.2313 type:complete len:289 (-) Transcript_997:240-1106(-)
MSGSIDNGIVSKKNAQPIISTLLASLQFFSQWKSSTAGNKNEFLPVETWYGIQSICHGCICIIHRVVIEGGGTLNITSIETDCVENHFNHTRQKGGGTQNPTVTTAGNADTSSLIVRTSGSKKGNNGGKGTKFSLGVNETCKYLKDMDSSEERGANRQIGKAMLSSIASADGDGGGDDEKGFIWGETFDADADAVDENDAQMQRSPPISFDAKVAIWDFLDKQRGSTSADMPSLGSKERHPLLLLQPLRTPVERRVVLSPSAQRSPSIIASPGRSSERRIASHRRTRK